MRLNPCSLLMRLWGVQLLPLGVIGEYLAKIRLEIKRRPLYFVDQIADKRLTANATRGCGDTP